VLRVEVGQKYEISDNVRVFLAEVETARKERIVFRTLEELPVSEPRVHVTLYASLIQVRSFRDDPRKSYGAWVLLRLFPLRLSVASAAWSAPSKRGSLDGAASCLKVVQQFTPRRLPEITGPVGINEALKHESGARLFSLTKRELELESLQC